MPAPQDGCEQSMLAWPGLAAKVRPGGRGRAVPVTERVGSQPWSRGCQGVNASQVIGTVSGPQQECHKW